MASLTVNVVIRVSSCVTYAYGHHGEIKLISKVLLSRRIDLVIFATILEEIYLLLYLFKILEY
jgi:hypothetical protein